MTSGLSRAPTVAIVGGGLAGIAAAVALGSSGCQVELFESRRSLGGRAASFRDPATDELVDHCQHVSMRCCTNLTDFCSRTGIAEYFRRDSVLNFFGPDAKHYKFQASSWLPAPLHLLPAFASLKYLSLRDRFLIGRALWQLMRHSVADDTQEPTVGDWLKSHGQSAAAIEYFWGVILVSALGEQLDRASLAAARKVLVDGFLASRDAYVVEVPRVPLGTLYGKKLEAWLADHGTRLHLNTPVRQIHADPAGLVLSDGREVRSDFVIVALPWTKIGDVLSDSLAERLTWLESMGSVEAAPITGVHLWFDREVTSLPHAVIVGRLSQWIFNRKTHAVTRAGDEHYYQVVISASRELAGRDRNEVVAEVCRDLAAIWPRTTSAKLLRSRVVTEHAAVFSFRPGLEQQRPAQETSVPGLLVAGDWTATGWPSTMESAVRSGYLAAESILISLGRPQKFLVDDLPPGPLARLLIKRA